MRTFENKEIVFPRELEDLKAPFEGRGHSRGVRPVLSPHAIVLQCKVKLRCGKHQRTGTVYSTFGFGLSPGQLSRVCLKP